MIRLFQHQKMPGQRDTETPTSFSSVTSDLLKRALDLTAAFFGLILLSPLFIFIAVRVKRDSPGPVFYWGTRIGHNGRPFRMLKFRTMYENEKSYKGPRVTCLEDDRITPFGKWLRDTKINELPQLWNVLIGDMSLVGPRPEDPAIAKTWPTKIARELLSVRPGVTSPASVVYRDEESMLHVGDVMRKYLHELSPDKMRLDQLYVRYRSFWLDIDVILWTILLLLPKIKTYSPPEQLLFVGPISRLIHRYVSWFIWDFLMVLASIAITGAIVSFFGTMNIGWQRAVQMALGFAILYASVGLVFGTDRINWSKASAWESGRLWACWFITTITTLGIYYWMGIKDFRALGILLFASILSLSGMIFIRYRKRLTAGLMSRLLSHHMRLPTARERVLIVGSGRTAEHIAWLMDHPAYSKKFQIVGFIDDDFRSQGMTIYGSRVIGGIKDISKVVQNYDVGLIILADSQAAFHQFKKMQGSYDFRPVRIVVAPDIFGSLSGLGGDVSRNSTIGDLDDFQCQHCLARYSAVQNTNYEPCELPVLSCSERIDSGK